MESTASRWGSVGRGWRTKGRSRLLIVFLCADAVFSRSKEVGFEMVNIFKAHTIGAIGKHLLPSRLLNFLMQSR